MTTTSIEVERHDAEAVNSAKVRQPLYAARKKIFPKRASGQFRRFKWLVMFVTLGIYYLTPWLRWDRGPHAPDQAVLIDLANRRFYFFFLEIWPQEFYYVTGLLILASLGLFLVTSVAGRVWCGYACPQTVWTDLFIHVERFFEGDRAARIREMFDLFPALAARRRELEDIQWEFKKQRFDDPGSSFKEDRLVGDLLNDFLRGGISAASYWDQWRKSQNWAPGSEWGAGYKSTRSSQRSNRSSPWPPSGGGFQWPDSSFGGTGSRKGASKGGMSGGFGGGWGGGSSGGGFSRPRTGTSGSRKQGGFKTGGGF